MKILFAVSTFNRVHYSVPYGIATVATFAKNAGLDVKIIFASETETAYEFNTRLSNEIKKQNINIVAVGGHSVHYSQLEELIRS